MSFSYSERIVNLNVQILYDKATRILTYITSYGGYQTLPEVSEELDWMFYRDKAPYGVFNDCRSYKLNSSHQIVRRDEVLSKDEEDRIRLLQIKCWVMGKVLSRIAYKRMPFTKELPLQDEIYQIKVKEATKFLSTGDIKSAYPFLESYAVIENITLKQAAELIIFKEKEKKECLRITEHNRLFWGKKIQEAKTIEKMTSIIQELQDRRLITSDIFPFSY